MRLDGLDGEWMAADSATYQGMQGTWNHLAVLRDESTGKAKHDALP